MIRQEPPLRLLSDSVYYAQTKLTLLAAEVKRAGQFPGLAVSISIVNLPPVTHILILLTDPLWAAALRCRLCNGPIDKGVHALATGLRMGLMMSLRPLGTVRLILSSFSAIQLFLYSEFPAIISLHPEERMFRLLPPQYSLIIRHISILRNIC